MRSQSRISIGKYVSTQSVGDSRVAWVWRKINNNFHLFSSVPHSFFQLYHTWYSGVFLSSKVFWLEKVEKIRKKYLRVCSPYDDIKFSSSIFIASWWDIKRPRKMSDDRIWNLWSLSIDKHQEMRNCIWKMSKMWQRNKTKIRHEKLKS